MKSRKVWKVTGTFAAMSAIVLTGMLSSSSRARADSSDDAIRIQLGLQIAPVKLNLAGKDRDLVGLGSYIVNALSDCNSCHTSGGPPNFDYASGGNPYFGQKPSKVDPTTYLGGGAPFGTVGLDPNHPGPVIVARNLTPDKTGRPEGGHTLDEFKQIIRNGIDFDHLHPTCSSTVTTNCIPAPVDGNLLQIMPWPTFAHMTDHDLTAIYEYLSAIPCIEGPPAPSPLHNACR